MMRGYVRVCGLSDLLDNRPLHVDIRHTPVCVVRTDGEVLALLDECSHAEVALSDGDVEAGTVECWLHGSRFDLRTGKPTGLPATEPVPVFPVHVDGDEVYVAVKE
ncbi:MAG TPA: non-heme iron oxygenase ferredoxin subunit [Mycobacteriales bacterium]|nr:non-heme iron oxygenase ferredoxin subunit [Mycobacteriales bacterium]